MTRKRRVVRRDFWDRPRTNQFIDLPLKYSMNRLGNTLPEGKGKRVADIVMNYQDAIVHSML